MADLGKKIRTFETDEPIRAPSYIPTRKIETIETPTPEYVPARTVEKVN